SLNLHIQYFKEGNVRRVELYDNLPLSLQVLKLDEAKLKKNGGQSFEITANKGIFRLKNLKTNTIYQVKSGSSIDIGFATIVLSTINQKTSLEEPLTNKFSYLDKMAAKYRNKISLIQTTKSSGLMELELKDPVKEKARDILDQLVMEFNRNAIED